MIGLNNSPLGNKIDALKSDLPQTNDDDIRMDNVTLNGNYLCYEFTMTDTILTKHFAEQVITAMKDSLIKYHCKEKLIIPFIKRGGTMYNLYKDKLGTLFAIIKIDNTDCLIK